MRPEALWGKPGTSGLQPCTRNHLKKGLEPHSLVWCGTWQIQLMPRVVTVFHDCANPIDVTHFSRPWRRNDTDRVVCVMSLDTIVSRSCLVWMARRPSLRVIQLRPTYSSNPGRAILPDFNSPQKDLVYHLASEAPLFLGKCRGAGDIFGMLGVPVQQPSARINSQKGFVLYSPVWWGVR